MNETSKARSAEEVMVEKYLCPGCVSGGDIECGAYDASGHYGHGCGGHVLGTSLGIGNSFALGLPRGFNKPGPADSRQGSRNRMLVRLWPAGTAAALEWNTLNVPVWSLESEGALFVRTYMPRINDCAVDVIEGGRGELTDAQVDALDEMTIDVAPFKGEID